MVSLGHSETDFKIKRSAYAAKALLASNCDELVGYFQLWSQKQGWRHATERSALQLQMRPWGARDGPGRALGLSQLSEVVPPGRQMEGYAGGSRVPPTQSLQWNQPTRLWFIPNHLASVAAGPTSEIKTCSSRWSDRQCTICPIALHVTDWSLP